MMIRLQRYLTICLAGLAFLLTVASSAPADEVTGVRRSVSLVTLDDYAPFCFAKPGRSNQGREVIAPGADSDYLQGYAWDVVREAFHTQGYFIVLDAVAWNYAEAAARLGSAGEQVASAKRERSSISVSFGFGGANVLSNAEKRVGSSALRADLLFPAVRTPAREDVFAFSARPVDRMPAVFYMPLNSPIRYDGMPSLSGKRVGVVRGWSYGPLFDSTSGVNRIELDDTETGFRLLRQNRLDALAGYATVYDRELKKIGWSAHFKKQPAGYVLDEFLCGIKGSDRTENLLAVFQKGMSALTGSGRLDALARKWNVDPTAR